VADHDADDPTIPSPKNPDAELVGQVVDGCRIVRIIGRGGMGAVYEGHEEMADRRVAVKTIRPDRVDKAAVRRFVNEVRAIAKISSPHVVQLYAAGELPGGQGVYMRMEFIEGQDLAEELSQREGGRAPIVDALQWMRDAARGLLAAEEAGVVHRDIKPANLLLRADGRVLVADFGIATLEDSMTRLTGDNIIGTVLYMGPEQFEGVDADTRSDIYSLGAAFFHVVTGRPPVEATSTAEIVRLKTTADCTLSPKSRLRDLKLPGLGGFDSLVRNMTARKPERRPQSFREVIDRLEGILDSAKAGDDLASRPNRWLPVSLIAIGLVVVIYLATVGLGGDDGKGKDAGQGPEGAVQSASAEGAGKAGGAASDKAETKQANPDPSKSGPALPAGTDTAESSETGESTSPDGASPDSTGPDGTRAEGATAEGTVPGATNEPATDGNEPKADPKPEGPKPEDPKPEDPIPDDPEPAGPVRAELAGFAEDLGTAEADYVYAPDLDLLLPRTIRDRRRGAVMGLVHWNLTGVADGGRTWFYADLYEVSVDQWNRVADAKVAVTDPRLPVTGVSLEEVRGFLAKLDGAACELPTVEQWQRMAFGPDGRRPFPWGGIDDEPKGVFFEATYGSNNNRVTTKPGFDAPQPVMDTGERSPEGIHGLVSNVAELLRPEGDKVQVVGVGASRVLPTASYARADFQGLQAVQATTRHKEIGFRCVLRVAEALR